MIFREDLAVAILRGEKTVTRRRLVDNPRSPWYRGHHPGDRYPEGSTFTVNPGRGLLRVGECEVTARYWQLLGSVDSAIAKQEGFALMVDFRAGWREINGTYDGEEEVEVVEFKLHGPDCMGCDGCGWCEGSPAFTCPDCFGTGIEVSPRGRALIAKLASA